MKQVQKNDVNNPKRCCPERFPSPKLPSPTNCLPAEVLERVNEEIRDANELLLDLALAGERPPEETYQKVFDGLLGLQVEITDRLGETIEGRVTLAGFDFVVLQEEEMTFILPYSQMELIKPSGGYAEPYPGSELTEIDPCLRRNLTFHFGEVVSSSPELIQLFFRIHLNLYLLTLENNQIQVKVDGSTVEGLLAEVNKETIDLKVQGERMSILLEKISHITIIY